MLYQVFGGVFHLDYFGEGIGLELTVVPLLAQGAGFPWCFLFVMGQWFVAPFTKAPCEGNWTMDGPLYWPSVGQ